jgi:hypothetical protein
MHIFNNSKIMDIRGLTFWSSESSFPIGSYRWHMRHKDAVMNCPRTRFPWTFLLRSIPRILDPFAGVNQSFAQLTQLRPDLTNPKISQYPYRKGHIVQGLIARGTKNTWDRKSQTQCLRTHWSGTHWSGTHCPVTVKTRLGICWRMTARWTPDFFFLNDSHITSVTSITSNWPRINLELTSGLPAARGEDHSGARRRGRTHRQQLPLGRHAERRRRPKGMIISKREIVLKRQVSLPT